MGVCSVCHQEKKFLSKFNNELTCSDCIKSMDEYRCEICQDQILLGSYYSHLRTKHTPEELAQYMADRAKDKRDNLYGI